jgi:hypothetical protein
LSINIIINDVKEDASSTPAIISNPLIGIIRVQRKKTKVARTRADNAMVINFFFFFI